MKVACLWFSNPLELSKIAEHCLRLSPQICFSKQALFIEIGKCHRIYNDAGFLARLQVILRRLQLKPQAVAIERDIPYALLKAKYKTSLLTSLPLTALVELADPFNRDEVLQKNILKMADSLIDVGIISLAQFQAMPLGELVNRYGPLSILCMQRLRGEVEIPWTHWKPEEVVTERTDFPYFEFYGELEPILFELKKHLDLVFLRLRARDLKAQKMQVRIGLEASSQQPERERVFDFDFVFPQNATKSTLNIIKERLYKSFQEKAILTPVSHVETKVINKVHGTAGQKNLLHNREETQEKRQALIAQLIEAHGRDNVFQAELTEDRRPEKSWRKVIPFTNKKVSKPVENKIPERPTYLIYPERIEIVAQELVFRGHSYPIKNMTAFYEKISGGWVESDDQNNSFERYYFTVELESSAQTSLKMSIFEVLGVGFFLHGYFG